jgi:hypothetical protein
MAQDAYVQVAADGAGKKVDTSELTRADGTVVERQRVNIADPADPNMLAPVTPEGIGVNGMSELIYLARRQNALLLSIAMQLASMAGGGFIDPDDLMEG